VICRLIFFPAGLRFSVLCSRARSAARPSAFFLPARVFRVLLTRSVFGARSRAVLAPALGQAPAAKGFPAREQVPRSWIGLVFSFTLGFSRSVPSDSCGSAGQAMIFRIEDFVAAF
jgi:hypothetical protein